VQDDANIRLLKSDRGSRSKVHAKLTVV